MSGMAPTSLLGLLFVQASDLFNGLLARLRPRAMNDDPNTQRRGPDGSSFEPLGLADATRAT